MQTNATRGGKVCWIQPGAANERGSKNKGVGQGCSHMYMDYLLGQQRMRILGNRDSYDQWIK